MYLNPKVGVAVLIEFDGKVLLAQRSEEPLKGWWTLPAGYVEYEESCEETARREADEELSTRIVLGSLFGVYSYGDDPRSRMVLVVYRATCDVSTIRAGDDISATCFFAPDQIPSDVAFQGNKDALSDWIQARQSFGAPQS